MGTAMLRARVELRQDEEPASRQMADIEALYQAELPKLMRYIRRKIGGGEDAADLAQDSFLKFIRVTPAVMMHTPEPYLRRIATNLMRDRADKLETRHEVSGWPLEEGWAESTGVDQHRELEGREELAQVERVLAGLKPITRHIFWLNRVEGMTYREIQERLALSEGVVKAHMRKAIARTARYRNAR
jgi:RNA polymerase sigma factor (sigma-70 family)